MDNQFELEIKALGLLAAGMSETEVAQKCGRSRSWVQKLKRNKSAEMQSAKDELKIKFKDAVKDELRLNSIRGTAEFLRTLDHISCDLLDALEQYTTKVRGAVEMLNQEDIKPRDIPTALRACGDVFQQCVDMFATTPMVLAICEAEETREIIEQKGLVKTQVFDTTVGDIVNEY